MPLMPLSAWCKETIRSPYFHRSITHQPVVVRTKGATRGFMKISLAVGKKTPHLRTSLKQMTSRWMPSTTKGSRQSANLRSLLPTGTPTPYGPHHSVQAKKSRDRGLVKPKRWRPAPWWWCGTSAKPCPRVRSERDPSPWKNWFIQSSLRISPRAQPLIIRLEAAEVTSVHRSTNDSPNLHSRLASKLRVNRQQLTTSTRRFVW